MSDDSHEVDSLKRQLASVQAELSGNTRDLSSIIVASVAALIVDMETGIIGFSTPRADQLFGYISAELIGKSIHDLVPPEVRKIHHEHFKKYCENPASRPMGERNMTLHGMKRNGEVITLEIGLHPHAWSGRRYVIATILKTRE